MRRRLLILAGVVVLSGSLLWSSRSKAPGYLGAADLRQFRSQAAADPSNFEKQINAALAYGALATEASQYLRAVRAARKLMVEKPAYGSQFDVKESLRQLVEDMNRYFKQRGIGGEAAFTAIAADGLPWVRGLLPHQGITRTEKAACLLVIARLELVLEHPAKALEEASQALELAPNWIGARFAKVDARMDLGQYARALAGLNDASKAIDGWAKLPPELELKVFVAEIGPLKSSIRDRLWIEQRRKVAAQLRGQVANQAAILTGLMRIDSGPSTH